MSIQRFAKAAAAIPLFMSLGCAAQMSQADLVGMQFPAERAPVSRNILMVVGNENGVVNYGTSIADVFVKNRLELDMGHTVTRMRDNAPADSLLMAANAADLVIIAESVTSGALNTKIVSTATPIFSYEAFLQDEFGLVNPQGRPVDPGPPADNADFGAIEDQTHIRIVNPSHPLAAGLSGLVQVYRFPREMNWGKAIAPSAEVVATLPDYPEAAVIYVIRKGAPLYDGTPAPGLRVQYYTENDNQTGTINLMTGPGLRMFDAAINYALTTDRPR